MTQVQTLATLALKPSSGKKGWKLELYDPLGQELLATYNSATNPGPISTGFNSRRYPNNTCGPGSFEAIPKHLIGGDPRNIVKLSLDTGTAMVPVFFGYISRAPDPRKGDVSRFDLVSGKELLKNSPIRSDLNWSSTQPRDVAVWIAELVGNFKHPALKYHPSYFPMTGVTIPGPEVRGTNLYEAIEAMLKAVPTLKPNDWGVDPEGYVTVRPATGSKTFTGEDFTLKYGDRDGEQVCTQVTLRIANRVSEGAIVSAGYVPRLISYTHTDPADQIYSAPRLFDLPQKSDGSPILEVLEYSPVSGFGWNGGANGWQSSTGAAVNFVCNDGNLNTYAFPGSASPGFIRVNPSATAAPGFVGGTLVIDAPAGTYDLALSVEFNLLTVGVGSVNKYKVRFDLNALKGQGKVEGRYIAPIPTDTTINDPYVYLVLTGTVPTSLKLYEHRGLQANTAILSQIARSNIRLPARQVSQVTFARAVTEGQVLGGYLLETPVKTLRVPGEDGKLIDCEVTEYNDTCTTQEGILTRAETGEPIRNPIVNTINDAIRRAQERG